MNRARIFSFCILLGMALGSCSASPNRFLGSQAPNFTLPDLQGNKVELANVVHEKPTLVVFWATWCPTCNEEIPTLNQWTELYPGLQILAVNVEEAGDRVRKFAEKKKIRYPVLLDEKGEIAEQYGLVGIPAAVLIAKGGQVIYYGFSLPVNVEQLIKQ